MNNIVLLKDDLPKGFFVGLNTVFGKSATGKTTLCMQLSAKALSENKKVIFIDTENSFSFERIKFMGLKNEHNLILCKPKSFFEQEDLILKFSKLNLKNLGLFVVDTVGIFYRLQAKKSFSLTNESLKRQIFLLKKISQKNNVPIIISNQVYTDITSGKTKMLGDALLKKNSDLIIELKKSQKRFLSFTKPFVKTLEFKINDRGLIPPLFSKVI